MDVSVLQKATSVLQTDCEHLNYVFKEPPCSLIPGRDAPAAAWSFGYASLCFAQPQRCRVVEVGREGRIQSGFERVQTSVQ